MAATMFFPPPSIPSCNPVGLSMCGVLSEPEDDQEAALEQHLRVHANEDTDGEPDAADGGAPREAQSREEEEVEIEEEVEGEEDDEEEEEAVEEGDEEEEEEVEVEGGAGAPTDAPLEDETPAIGRGLGLGLCSLVASKRVTLKPRRTLSLSPTPARAGDMMARNLRAARFLDFIDKDDDDGLCQLSDSDSEIKKKNTVSADEATASRKVGLPRRGNSLTLGSSGFTRGEFGSFRKPSSSMKRPLEVTLPCQKIEYLDISYQKVGIHSVRFSPIARKKISYHPVPYHAIHYCEVNYLGERPVKRKPPS